jgi:DNA-directed RNA polymerase specialized sigma24 family protein
MSGVRNRDSAFGRRSTFPPTRWTRIEDAGQREAVREELYKQYWDPLYCYARRKGFRHEDAKNFTQDFLTDILMGKRKLLSKADKRRGKFHSLLVKSFENFIRGYRRKKRVPTGAEADVSEYEVPDAVPQDPAAALDRVWAIEVLHDVLAELESECQRDGLQSHWGAFQERLLKRLHDQPPSSIKEVCRKYAISSAQQASNMLVTVIRRFHRILVRYLLPQGGSEDEIKEAIRDFMAIFSQSRPA